MPELLCNETKASSYDGGFAINDRVFGLAKKEFVTVYEVKADNAQQTEDDILATPGIPPLWLNLRGGYCVKRQAKEINTQALLWEVKCDFTSEINPENANNQDPESAAPQWEWTVESQEESILKDANGKTCRTTAGELFTDVVRPIALPILTITRYQSVFDPNVIVDYCNRVNRTEFWGVPPGSILCSGISDSQQSINATNYRRVTYTFKTKLNFDSSQSVSLLPQAWQLDLLMYGTYALIDPNLPDAQKFSEDNRSHFLDSKGRPTTGALKADGTENPDADPLNAVYDAFDVYADAEFNDLNLGPW